MDEIDEQLLARADAIAAAAHSGQVDKAGQPYIGHPRRVAARVRELFPNAAAGVEAAALLHDVVEDTPVTGEDLARAGLPADVVTAVEAVTKRAGESIEAYFVRVRANEWGAMVKTADLDDNTDPARLAQLDPATRLRLERKYAKSRALLAGG